MSIYKKLIEVQTQLHAPKNQYNSFGKYHYRNCEDILEALKPLLKELNTTIIISDKIVNIQNRFYVEAEVLFIDIETGEKLHSTAYAREEESKKGMDGSQVTGAASSYARKYALNGLFGIDDTKDSDTTNTGEKTTNKPKEYKCVDCGTPFKEFTDKNGKTWNAGQVYHMAEGNNTDKKARCKTCREKAGTTKAVQ